MAEKMTGRTDRLYLAVPFDERQDARRQGARWDQAARRWYAPPGSDLSRFARWTGAMPQSHPFEDFSAALAAAGLLLDGAPLMDGALHRVRVQGDRMGEKSGAYIGHLDHRPAGFIQNFKTGEKHNWKAAAEATLTVEERTRLSRAIAVERESRQALRAAIHRETSHLLEDFLARLPIADRSHPYLQRKRVDAHGLLLNTAGSLAITGGRTDTQDWSAKGDLILPIRDECGALISAQSIDHQGRKSFPRGGRVTRGCHLIGDPFVEGFLVIAEGYATAATIHELTRLAVAVAFNAGNLEMVARCFRAAYPELPILIAGDNDHHKARQPMHDGRLKPNAGREAAEKAADVVGSIPVLPSFATDDPGTDWNDLAASGSRHFFEQWQPQIEAFGEHLGLRAGKRQRTR